MNLPNRKFQIQFWAHFLPSAGIGGAGAYTESMLQYLLAEPDFCIDVHILRPSETGPLLPEIDRHTHIWHEDFEPDLLLSQRVYAQTKRRIPAWLLGLYSRLTPLWFRDWLHRIRVRSGTPPPPSTPILKYPSNVRDLITRLLTENRPDCVVMNYVWMADFLQLAKSLPKCFKVLITHDVLHQRSLARQDCLKQQDPLAWTPELERQVLQSADLIVAIQQDDAAVFRALCPDKPVIVAPFSKSIVRLPPASERGRCLFVASPSDHNLQGIEWFVTQIWPLILQHVPYAQLIVAGTIGRKFQSTDASVTVLGYVADLADVYRETEVCLVPLQFGSGLKIKLLEALAYGRASVSTSVGLQGVDFLEGQGVLRANTAEEFAAAVVQILQNPELRVQQQKLARSSIERWFSAKACYAELAETIRNALVSKHVSSAGIEAK